MTPELVAVILALVAFIIYHNLPDRVENGLEIGEQVTVIDRKTGEIVDGKLSEYSPDRVTLVVEQEREFDTKEVTIESAKNWRKY